MATPTYATVISQINTYIVANANNEITANVLNPILKVITGFANNTIGNLTSLTTTDTDTIVGAINSLKVAFENLQNNGIQLSTGYTDPNVTPPASYGYGDFYMELDNIGDVPIQLWQWNGNEWTTYSSVYTKAEIDFIVANLESQISTSPGDYSKVVYVNDISPSTATIFDTINPPVTNDNLLKNDTNNLYIGTDASIWVYLTSPAGYVTKVIPNLSNFYFENTTIDAGSNKTSIIERPGGAIFGGDLTANNLSGTNTGDQDLSGKLDKNTAIVGATKTKITYDADGLITSGADATTADIADSLNKRYVTDSDIIDIGNLSGINTGDQDLSGKEDKSNKNIANGYAGLDANLKINPSQLPALAITDTFVVASQAAMLALTAEIGDIAVRTDLNKSYILRVTGASTLANWQELLTPTDAVSSVFGRSGVVTAQANDYNADQVLETATKVFVTPAEKTAITHTNRIALDLVSGTNTGDQDLSPYELLSNKKTDIEANKTSNIFYAPIKAIVDWIELYFLKGSGTQNYLPKFGVGGKVLGNSQIFDNGTNVGIGTTTSNAKLEVVGNGLFTGTVTATGFLGNATTASSLTSNQTNWVGTGVLSNVVGTLAWKNYGNGHVIFDASASLSPNSNSVNNTNPIAFWSPTYPTLMGWNGENTYGVRVDSARVADTVILASSVQVGDNTAVASASNVGAIRYRVSGNNSYAEMCMQTGASTYEWTTLTVHSW